MKLCFVCLGNICRSPLAHTVMEKKLQERNLNSGFVIDSSGLGDWHVGKPSDSRMRETAAHHGYDITHRAQQFHSLDGENFHYIFAMDQSIYTGILQMIHQDHHDKVMMFRKFDPDAPDQDVPDPYYGGKEGFEVVFNLVESNCERIIDHLLLVS